MNLQPFYDLRERLHVVANAGVNLITEDFRLKRAVEAIAPFAKVSPVFQKIEQMVKKLISPACPDRSMVLLDTLALLDAVLTTQGQIGIGTGIGAGAIGTIESLGNHEDDVDFFQHYVDINSRVLRPLVEAMTGIGGGRYNIIQETYNTSPELFDDFRIRRLLVDCLGDSYSEIANMAVKWLKEKGSEIVPVLKKDFDPKGKKEMVHRVHIIAEIAGAKENAFYLEQIPESQKEVKEVLIESLRFDQRNATILLDLIKSEKGKAKASAQWASSFMDDEKVKEYWAKAPSAPKFLEDSEQEWVGDLLAKRLIALIKQVTNIDNNTNDTITNAVIKESDYNMLLAYLQAIRNKKISIFPELIQTLIENAGKIDTLTLKRNKENANNITNTRFTELAFSGLSDSVVITVANIENKKVQQKLENKQNREKNVQEDREETTKNDIKEGINEDIKNDIKKDIEAEINSEKKWLLEMTSEITKLCDAYKDKTPAFLETAFIIAIFTKPAEQVYEEFSKYLGSIRHSLKNKEKSAKKVAFSIFEVFNMLQYNKETKKYTYYCYRGSSWKGEYREAIYVELPYGLDTRWYPLLFQSQWKQQFDVIAYKLFRYDTEELKKLYGQYYYKKSCVDNLYGQTIERFMECGYGSTKGILTAQFFANAQSKYAVRMLTSHMLRTLADKLQLSREEVLEELKEVCSKTQKIGGKFISNRDEAKLNEWIKCLEEGAEVNTLI